MVVFDVNLLGDMPGSGECVPDTGGGDCDPECQSGEICVNGECVPDGDGCVPACGADEDCVNDECIPSPEPGPCQPPCGSDEICVNSSCVPDPGGCDPACQSYEICVNETCVPDGTGCDPACQPGESCVDDVCVPDGTGCNPECPSNEICVNGTCVPDDASCDPECDVDEDCVNGECVPKPPCPECQKRDSVSGECINDDGASCGDGIHYTCQSGSCNCTAADEWDVGDAMTGPTIDAPASGAVVAAGATVQLSCSGATDTDSHSYCSGNEWVSEDPPPSDTISHTWTAKSNGIDVGSFPSGNTGTDVQWKAPDSGLDVTITVTADDEGAHGTDNDGTDSNSITITVIEPEIQIREFSRPANRIAFNDPRPEESINQIVIWHNAYPDYASFQLVPVDGDTEDYSVYSYYAGESIQRGDLTSITTISGQVYEDYSSLLGGDFSVTWPLVNNFQVHAITQHEWAVAETHFTGVWVPLLVDLADNLYFRFKAGSWRGNTWDPTSYTVTATMSAEKRLTHKFGASLTDLFPEEVESRSLPKANVTMPIYYWSNSEPTNNYIRSQRL